MSGENVIENFFGVYLLYCENPKYIGRTYIGYTVDPNRRIKQHNKGKHAGGAWRTSNRGPWRMVLIVHGFPNDVAALRFEWAWQHPDSSRRLKYLEKKKRTEKVYDYLIRILSEMLKMGPWNRLPLTIRWLAAEYAREFNPLPPTHMPICYGGVTSKKIPKPAEENEETLDNCFCCDRIIADKFKLRCIDSKCDLVAHITCLGNSFLEVGEYVPVEGNCPKCGIQVLWGDLVRKYKGCYSTLMNIENVEPTYFYDSE